MKPLLKNIKVLIATGYKYKTQSKQPQKIVEKYQGITCSCVTCRLRDLYILKELA